MRRKWGESSLIMIAQAAVLLVLLTISPCEGNRRTPQRRKTARSDLYLPSPSAESLQALAQAMGAAGFESYTEGKALVKRLIPADSQPDLDVVEHQGVIGKAGVDFPAFPNIPNTGFNCKNVPTGYYADLETDCQVFHICDTSRKISFLCPNGTIFSQSHLICDWWFKVDCASAPALYESSAEYYSSEQRKTHKVTQSLSKNSDLQQIGADTNIRPETRKAPTTVPSTTERLLRHRQRLQNDPSNAKATSRSFQSLFTADSNFYTTQRTQATTAFEKRRKNLVQLIANNFGNTPRPTLPTYTEASSYRTTTPTPIDYNSIKEMQVAAESASFANNNNRQYLQDYNKNYRPYPVYTPNLTARLSKTKSSPTLTTLYDIRDKNLVAQESTTKRPSLVPYTKSYSSTINERREPYTRPGVSLLKDFLEKEKNKTLTTTTERFVHPTERSDIYTRKEKTDNRITIETKDTFESATKIPHTTRPDNTYFTETASSDRFDVYSTTNQLPQVTTEPSYHERRERLMRKLNLDTFGATEPTAPTTITEKFYGDLPNRPGLVVPPSLTPKTLHTLAIYYATALDNLSATTPAPETETTTNVFDEYENIDDGLPALFSRHTINKYSNLFGHGTDNSELLEDIKLDPNGTYNELADDLSVQQSQNPLATSPQIRELAQVFTHALSAYLQDPVQFRKVLSDIRPTHPSFGDMLTTTEDPYNTEPTTTINEDDDEILGFSDDNKARPALASLRDAKSINIGTDYPSFSEEYTTTPRITEAPYTTARSTTAANPFRCCGRISASYTSPSTPKEISTTPIPYTNTVAANVNTLANNYNDTYGATESAYIPKYGGFQNNTVLPNNSPYGIEVNPTNAKPLNEYIEATNLPTAWGIDAADTTSVTNAHGNIFESKKIRTTTALPITTAVYFTETDSVELENEEELQRAHSQSFVTPQSNNLRQGKQISYEDNKTTVKKPSEELEAPTLPDFDTTTVQTTQPTTIYSEALTTAAPISSSSFTSPDSDKTTYQFQWPSTYENWQSTVIDPITLNDNLSPSAQEHAKQTHSWTNTATTVSSEYTGTTSEPIFSSSDAIELTTPGNKNDDRLSRLLRDPTSTEAAQDLTTITDTVVEKAKEIMGGMNATTTEKLMNVMKKTKSKTVRRLILLLVQTCDDDHNTTAEASKKALLEALMAVSQKDMDEIAKEEGITDIPTTVADYEITKTSDTQRRTDKVLDRQEIRGRQTDRRGKSLNIDPSAVNSLSNPSTPENIKQSEILETASTTQSPKLTTNFRRGAKKFLTRSTTTEPTVTKEVIVDSPKAEARTAAQGSDLKTSADTRALELLRSLYTIAARWG
ncbi:mucin-3A isoform X2 [Pectinophora gossypiella]|uniref:mucin-3A isoform X2 n=1 Tax=Pectinophora gossypiella TaxID=13191 RepID=UPI00214E7AA7|nr:mucin-3A isoform X2 [Pectinophora gossypiella]